MRKRCVFFSRAGTWRAPSPRALPLRALSLGVCFLLVVALTLTAIPSSVFAQVGEHRIEAFGNEFEIKTPEDWATGDLDGGKLVVDDSVGGGAIRLADDATEATYTSADIDMCTFEYLVMSWNADCPEGTWIEVTASVWLDNDRKWSTYLTWGKWSPFIKRASHASYSSSEAPDVDISTDEFYVRGDPAAGDTASKVRLKVILHRDNLSIESPVLWYLHGAVRIDGVEPTKVFKYGLGEIDNYVCEVDVPQYSQMVRSSNISGVMCSAATGAMMVNSVAQMDGNPLNVLPEEFAMGCLDFRANSFGNWSFTMATAGSYGYQSYVDYSTIEGIKRHLKSGYAVGASVAYSIDPTAPDYLENAYGATPGHLIVLRGYTVIDGVEYFISNDPYNPSNDTVRKLYRVDQFEKVWSRYAIYVVKPGKLPGVGNHPVKRVHADLEEVEPGRYALSLDVFGENQRVVTPSASSLANSRRGFIAYIVHPEEFEGASPSYYDYISVTTSSDLLTLSRLLLEDPLFRLYVANFDVHTGKLFIVDKDSEVKPLVPASVESTDYNVTGDEISPNAKGIILGETTVQEFLSGLEPAPRATMKLFPSGTVVEDAADFESADAKTTGALAEGDFVVVLGWDGVTIAKYSISPGAALLPMHLTFAQDNVALYHIDFPFTNPLYGHQGNGAMTWASSNTGVARVDANGQVTPYNVGHNAIIAVSVASDGVYQSAKASYKLAVLRGLIHEFHWGTIAHPKVGEVPQNVYTPSPLDQPDLFFFSTNEPRFTWTGELENGRFTEGVAYSVEVRLQSNDYPGGNSAYFYWTPLTAEHIHGLPKVGDSTGTGAVITGVKVTRNNNYQLTVRFDYSPLQAPVSVSRYAVVALDGDVSMAGNSKTASDPAELGEGDVYASGNIIMKGNAAVGGDATATGSVTMQGSAKVAGEVIESLAIPVYFETLGLDDFLAEHADGVDLDAVKAQAVPEKKVDGDYVAPNGTVLGTNGTYSWIDGDLTISGNSSVTLDGVLLVSGSVMVNGNAKMVGNGVIISEGGVTVSGNASVEGAILAHGDIVLNATASSRPSGSGGVPLVMSLSGSVEVGGNGWLGARVHAPNGEVRFSGNAKVYGSVAGKSVTLGGNNQVVYPVWLKD